MFKFCCFGLLVIGFSNASNIQSGGYNYEQLGLSDKLTNGLLQLRNGIDSGLTMNSAELLSGAVLNTKRMGLGYSGHSGPLSAAIQSKRFYRVIPVPSSHEPAVPQVIDVGPTEQPVKIIFRTVSSPVLVQQIHSPGAPGHSESTHSEDEPHKVLHEVLRPVIQEVREIIQPYRRVTQEVRPVLEEVHTIVAKGDGIRGKALGASALTANTGALGLSLNSGKGLALSEGDLSGAYSGEGLAYQMNSISSDYSSAAKKS